MPLFDDSVHFRGWWAGRWWDPPQLGMTNAQREAELIHLVGDGWELGEALAAVEAPSYWPIDTEDDLDAGAAS